MSENSPAEPAWHKQVVPTDSSMSIVPAPGAHIDRTSADAQRVADILGINIEFSFNGVKCRAVPGGCAKALASRQHSEMGRRESPSFKFASSRLHGAESGQRECPSSPNGRHQIDTSMESGPHNCFHCERPM